MAATIKIKNSSTAGAVPTASDLVQGELAINVTDRRIFTENASGTVVELGTPSIDDNGNATAITIDSSENVGIGTSSPAAKLHSYSSDTVPAYLQAAASSVYLRFGNNNSTNGYIGYEGTSGTNMTFYTNNIERSRIDSSGNLLVGKMSDTFSTVGGRISPTGVMTLTADSNELANFNRLTNDGALLYFSQASTIEGSISVSGTTVSYNGGHLARYAQTVGAKDESLVKGTVMSNLDEMNFYIASTTYWTEEDELPEGVSVGDVKVEEHEVANEQLNKVKVSDIEGDVNVAGVFVNWSFDEQHSVDEINMAMTGDMIIRIAQGVSVARGDLLMSAGDGTAKPQGDDIVRAKTVAKVTSTSVTCTYEDGSYCVPCVLMAC